MASIEPPKLIAFDIGGVLADAEKSLDDDFYFQGSGFVDFSLGRITSQHYFAMVARLTDKPVAQISHRFRNMIQCRDYCRTLLQSAAIPFTFLSNINESHFLQFLAQGVPSGVKFENPGVSFLLQCLKPNPIFFQRYLKTSSFLPQEIIFIDDKLANVLAAKRLGINAFIANRESEIFSILKEHDCLDL